MRTLPCWCAAMIVWMIAVANAHRLPGSLELGALAYGLTGAALSFVVIPRLRELSTLWILALAFPTVFALELLFNGPIDAARLPSVLLGFAVVGITLFLASRLGRRLHGVETALDDLAMGDTRTDDFTKGQTDMFREVRRARRYERPLSMLAISGVTGESSAALSRLLGELRRDCLERYASARLASLLTEESDGAAIVAEHGDHFLVLLPEATPHDAARMAERLKRFARERWELSLNFGISSFPNPELTFDGLVESAESAMRTPEAVPTADTGMMPSEAVASPVLKHPRQVGS